MQALKRLRRYNKVIFTRNPLDRLLSAWKDKLYDTNHFYAERVGSQIIAQYRPNATDQEIQRGTPVMLGEFLQYIDEFPMPTRFFDPHWKPIHENCFPCAINYTYVGKLETLIDDVGYVARKATGLESVPPIMASRAPMPLEQDMRYQELRKLPRQLVERVLAKYKIDYEMFGYDMQRDLENVYSIPSSK